MKLLKLVAIIVILATIILTACQKDFSIDQQLPFTDRAIPNITAVVKGRVVDEQGKPLQGASVKAGTTVAISDINGEFTIQNAGLYDKAAFVKVTKAGYFTGSRTFMARAGQTHFIEIGMLQRKTDGTVNSAAGGTVTLTSGASVTLAAAGVVNKTTGAAYTGEVNISVAWIDPTSGNLYREMPGDLRGINNNNVERGLQSFGMIVAELSGSAGEALQIAPGKKATVKFPLPSAVSGKVPATIALWHFNDTTALWKQEGTAIKSGNFYQAEVSHFSFWNCDMPFPVVDFSATIVDQDNKALQFALIRIKRTADTSFSFSYAYTDANGVVAGMIPANEPLVLEVLSICGTSLYSQNIGPYSSPANLAITATNSMEASTITGTALDCNNNPVSTGSAELIVGFNTYRTGIANGAFTFNLALCSSNQAARLIIIDSGTNQQSAAAALTINEGSNSAGTLTACGISSSQFINVTVGSTDYAFVYPTDSLTVVPWTQTLVFGSQSAGNSIRNLYFSFPGNATGSFELIDLTVSVPALTDTSAVFVSPITINVTEYGGVGEYVAGDFTGDIFDGTTPRTIVCSFRIRRNY